MDGDPPGETDEMSTRSSTGDVPAEETAKDGDKRRASKNDKAFVSMADDFDRVMGPHLKRAADVQLVNRAFIDPALLEVIPTDVSDEDEMTETDISKYQTDISKYETDISEYETEIPTDNEAVCTDANTKKRRSSQRLSPSATDKPPIRKRSRSTRGLPRLIISTSVSTSTSSGPPAEQITLPPQNARSNADPINTGSREAVNVNLKTVPTHIQIGRSGLKMPRVAIGILPYVIKEQPDYIPRALKAGYTHIDTSVMYVGTDESICEAIHTTNSDRASLFLTNKILMPEARKPDEPPDKTATYNKIMGTIMRLDPECERVDLFMIGSEGGSQKHKHAMWIMLEIMRDEGSIGEIGVCNWGIQHLEQMRGWPHITWPPAVNQLELHPWCQQTKTVRYCREHGIIIQAYFVLAKNKRMNDPVLTSISMSRKRSKESILIRWSLQKDFMPVLRDVPLDLEIYKELWDFELDENEMKALDSLDEGKNGAQGRAVENTRGDELHEARNEYKLEDS